MGKYLSLVAFIVTCQAVGAVGGVMTAKSVKTWYPTLKKPSFNPPSWVFGPVWTTLYLFMAIAAWLCYRINPSGAWGPAFAVQLMLNLLWSYIFFGMRMPKAAFFELAVLWVSIGVTMYYMSEVSWLATILMVPYIVWTTFAATLNFSIWKLNQVPFVFGRR